jgi:hypothetical protein
MSPLEQFRMTAKYAWASFNVCSLKKRERDGSRKRERETFTERQETKSERLSEKEKDKDRQRDRTSKAKPRDSAIHRGPAQLPVEKISSQINRTVLGTYYQTETQRGAYKR